MLASRDPPIGKSTPDPRGRCWVVGGAAIWRSCSRGLGSETARPVAIFSTVWVAAFAFAADGVVTVPVISRRGDGRSSSYTIVFGFPFLIRSTTIVRAASPVTNTRRVFVALVSPVTCDAAAGAVAAFLTAESRHGVGRGAEGRGDLFLRAVGLVAQALPQVELHLPEDDGGEGLDLDHEVTFLVVLGSVRGALEEVGECCCRCAIGWEYMDG